METKIPEPIIDRSSLYVADMTAAYDMALGEDKGYSALVELGYQREELQQAGKSFHRIEVGDQVFEGNAREMLGRCPYIGALPLALARANLEATRVAPEVRAQEVQALVAKNLAENT